MLMLSDRGSEDIANCIQAAKGKMCRLSSAFRLVLAQEIDVIILVPPLQD